MPSPRKTPLPCCGGRVYRRSPAAVDRHNPSLEQRAWPPQGARRGRLNALSSATVAGNRTDTPAPFAPSVADQRLRAALPARAIVARLTWPRLNPINR